MADNNENEVVDSNVLRYLQERIKLNIGLIEKLKTISDTIKNEKKFDEIVEAEVVGIFSNWSSYAGQMNGFSLTEGGTLDQMKTILSKIKQNSGQITTWCGDFIKIVEDENKSIYNYINKKPTVMGLGNIISLIENNFGTQIPNIWEQLRLKLGEKANENEYVMSMELKGVEQIGKAYIKLYLGLRSLIIGRNPKNEIVWHSIYENLKEIQKSLSHFTGGYQGDLLKFIDNNKPKYFSEIKKFAENFFPSGKSFNLYFQEYLKYFKEDGTPTYSNLDETQKKVVDKTLNDSIELLFKGIKIIKTELETSKDKNDDEFKKLKETYEQEKQKLREKLSNEGYSDFIVKNGLDPLEIRINENNKEFYTFKEIDDLKPNKNNKKILTKAIDELININDRDFEGFINLNARILRISVGNQNPNQNSNNNAISQIKNYVKKFLIEMINENGEELSSDLERREFLTTIFGIRTNRNIINLAKDYGRFKQIFNFDAPDDLKAIINQFDLSQLINNVNNFKRIVELIKNGKTLEELINSIN